MKMIERDWNVTFFYKLKSFKIIKLKFEKNKLRNGMSLLIK